MLSKEHYIIVIIIVVLKDIPFQVLSFCYQQLLGMTYQLFDCNDSRMPANLKASYVHMSQVIHTG